MQKPRYSLKKMHGEDVINDAMTGGNWPFGRRLDSTLMREKHKHRLNYSVLDAKAVVDWLNERNSI